jgi:hypothetical protein
MPVAAHAVPVDCDAGQTISTALAQGATLVRVSGTCTENVEILRDDVTIQGTSGATLVGGISITGARRIVIKNLTIQTGAAAPDGSTAGIAARDGASMTVTNVLVRDIPITSSGLPGYGVLLDRNASGVLDNTRIRRAFDGVYATGSSFVEIRNGSVIANNDEVGIWIDYASSARVDGSQIQNNAVDDAILASRSSAVRLTNNAIENNVFGIESNTNASIFMRGNMVTGGGTQVWLRSGGTLRSNGGNTIQADVAIDMAQGTELVQRIGHDTVIGSISLSDSDVARFEDVEIQGDVTITGRSTLKMLEQGSSPNTRVTGGISIDQDSGLSFEGGGDNAIEVLGGITCADPDSSVTGLANVNADVVIDPGPGCTVSP